MNGSPWRTARVVVGAAILAAVLWRTGTGPLLDGLRALGPGTLALGAALALPSTVACACRWRLVARGLGVGVALGPAVASCYRAQLLNLVLPGGVVGDVHRGVRHGRDAGDVPGTLRTVAWERVAGQVVQVAVTLLVLELLPSPVREHVPATLGLLVTIGVALAALALPVRRAWPGVVLASTVALACHVATFLVAARAVGVTAPWSTLVPVVMLVLLAAALPVNVAGWGPREGMAAWSFAAAGLGAAHGVATAAAYAAIVLVANLPGAVVLVAARRRHEAAAAASPTRERPLLPEGGPIHG